MRVVDCIVQGRPNSVSATSPLITLTSTLPSACTALINLAIDSCTKHLFIKQLRNALAAWESTVQRSTQHHSKEWQENQCTTPLHNLKHDAAYTSLSSLSSLLKKTPNQKGEEEEEEEEEQRQRRRRRRHAKATAAAAAATPLHLLLALNSQK